MEILYQTIGIIALIVTVLSFQIKDMKKLILVQGLGSLIWGVHFIIGEAYAGGICNFLSFVRCLGFALITNKKWRKVFLGIISACFLGMMFLAIFQFKELWFLALATTFGTMVGNYFFYLGNEKYYRYVQLGVISPCWLFYNIWYRSIGGIICEALNITSVIVSLIRFKIQKRKSSTCDKIKNGENHD